MTARDVVQRIRENLGIPWLDQTIRDTFKAGNPDTTVKGIASTVMATLDQLQRAHAAGCNMVITHEPTYWSDAEKIDLSTDPIYQFKNDYCVKNDMVVWRFHDNWHARKPDMQRYSLLRLMGLAPDDVKDFKGEQDVYTIPETTLAEFASRVRTKLHGNAFRVVGNPRAKIRRVSMGGGSGMPRFSKDVDLVVGGETAEVGGGDNTGYALDATSLGLTKAHIILGHVVSEEAGMEAAAVWLRTILPDVPVQFVPANEPFWDLG